MKSLRLENSPITYFVDDTANGKWVVFVHAAFVNHEMFETQFNYFSGKYNLLAVDILGHGDSVHARKGDGVDKTAEWINMIFEKHGIPAAHFVGVSLGSVFIQDFANEYCDKVLSLACFGGYDINNFDFEKQKSNSKAQAAMAIKAMISVKWFAESNKKISAYTPQAQEKFYNMNVKFRKKSFRYLAKLKNLVNKYPSEKRQYPLLVGCGEHDIPAEIEIVNEWSARENCDKVIISGAGHCANMDNPSEFNARLETFWTKTEKA